MSEEEMNEVYALLIKIAPPFAKENPEQVFVFIDLASEYVCKRKFKSSYHKALALYALHLMTLDGSFHSESDSVESMSRRVKSFSLSGEFSQTFGGATDTTSDNELLQTPWGKMFNALQRKKGRFGLLTGVRRGCYGL